MEGVRFGDFEVIKKIGEGGMGQVCAADITGQRGGIEGAA